MNDVIPESHRHEEKEMPFLEHLEELRWRLLNSLAAIVAGAILAYFFSDEILAILIKPYHDATSHLFNGEAKKLIFLNPTGGFMLHVKLAIFSGFLVALPVVFYQIWQFVVPGLLEKERKYVPLVVFLSTLCFAAGALFCYFVVLRYGLRFLLSFESADLVATLSVNEYLEFITMLILVFGIVFEMPILAFILSKIGLLTPAFMRHYRRHGIVTMFIIAAVITPTGDIINQLLLAGPLIVLYEVSILVSKIARKHSYE